MRTIRSFLPLILIALLLAACAGSAASCPRAGRRPTARPAARRRPADRRTPARQGRRRRADRRPRRRQDHPHRLADARGQRRRRRRSAPRATRSSALGGYVGASTTSNDGDRPSAEITYRIPADRWEQALDQLRGLNGLTTKVVAEHTEAVEVTGQVVDLDARIANLRASETALQGIAAKAVKISDVLEVQAQLTATRGEIESLTAQLKDLNDRAGYATLTVQYNVPIVAVEVAAKGWDPTAVVDEAAAAMLDVLQTLASAGIWFGHRLAADPAGVRGRHAPRGLDRAAVRARPATPGARCRRPRRSAGEG